ncbi:hypothetical protein ACO0LM_20060 [Undibacterium sp. Di26W]|uniref:hypothetical protein n=1 Tax=Undibacterium sp. Di26W TaxID=3413035 RepID=UPI003BEFC58D
MNSTKSNNLGSESMMLYALIVCNIAGVSFYVVNAILNQAPLLKFWLPAFAFLALYGYVSADEYKKLDAHTMTKGRNSLKSGIFFLVVLILIIAIKDWKASPLGFPDALILALFLSNTKDYIVAVLAIRKFASPTDPQ